MENQNTPSQANEHSKDAAISASTNNYGSLLSNGSNRLSLGIAIATALPLSSPASSPLKQQSGHGPTSIPAPPQLPKSPLHRTPSSSSLGYTDRSRTPTMHKRPSLSSLGSTPPRSPAIRRTSSSLAPHPKSDLPAPAEEAPPPTVTAASVAREFFEKELELHHEASNAVTESRTVVILQDNCYGHRYSRPRTSRAGLATIVERPERIHASILGLATAYVRLGGRHTEGHSPPKPKQHPSTHVRIPFRICKSDRSLSLKSQAATSIHGTKWMAELSSMCEAAESKLALNGKELIRPVSAEQSNGISQQDRPKLHEGDLYLCSESLGALEGALGGVCEGVDAVFNGSSTKRAFVCIRPPGHHCSADYPSGFCWLNNVHVGIGHAALTHGLTHAAIIDFDLHHGDGSQSITWAHNAKVALMPKNTPLSRKTAIGYFSLHDINSYPCEMGDEEKVRNASLCIEGAHGQTIWNVHLQPWKTEADFWALYESKYSEVLEKTRTFLRSHTVRLQQSPMHPQPRAAIFISAGFDASEWESPGMQRHQVNVPTDFYARFTRDVVRISEEEGLGVEGRVISVLEGGYSDRALLSGVLSHLGGLTAMDGMSHRRSGSSGLGQEMAKRLGSLNLNGDIKRHAEEIVKPPIETFDSNWWALENLEQLEDLVKPPSPATFPKKQRNAVPPTYSSTTQSYSAKIVSPPANRRSLSGNISSRPSAQLASMRVPEQPPPPVNWTTAAHELSKLLIPTDRQTKSCKPEDLNAEATRARRDRQSTVGLPAEPPILDGKRMQLRDRRGKAPKYASDEEEEKPISRANRRRTIADPAALAHEAETVPSLPLSVAPEKIPRPKSRRLSMASSAGSVNGERSSGSSLGSAITGTTQLRPEPLTIKKTRVPSGAPVAAPKPKAIKKVPPIPRVPSTYTTNQHNTEDQAPLTNNDDPKNQDINNLATGMKKMSIKLNMPTKELQEAREAKQKPAPRGRPKTTAPKKNEKKSAKAVSPSMSDKRSGSVQTPAMPDALEPLLSDPIPRPGSGKDSLDPGMLKAQEQALSVTEPSPIHDTDSTPTEAPIVEGIGPPPSTEIFAPDVAESQPTAFAPPADPSIPAQISPIASATYIQEPIIEAAPAQLPPSYYDQPEPSAASPVRDHPRTAMPTSPPPSTSKRKKHDLPVFSATSPIFFGKPTAVASSIDRTMTPQISAKAAQEPTPSAQLMATEGPITTGAIPSHKRPTLENEVGKENEGSSIWDVPDTPQVRRR